MRKLILAIMLLLCTKGNAQICNYCSEQGMKEILSEQDISTVKKTDSEGNVCLANVENEYTKCWHFKYDRCYLYDITIRKKRYCISMKRFLDKNFKKTSEYTWENLENKVELRKSEGYTQFLFTPKICAGIGTMN